MTPQPLSSCCVADPPVHFSQFEPCRVALAVTLAGPRHLKIAKHGIHFSTCDLFEIMENGQRILQKLIFISTKCCQLQGDFVPLTPWPGALPLEPSGGKPPDPLQAHATELTMRGQQNRRTMADLPTKLKFYECDICWARGRELIRVELTHVLITGLDLDSKSLTIFYIWTKFNHNCNVQICNRYNFTFFKQM